MSGHESVTSAAASGMPRLLYGTAWKKERTADLVATALAQGFRGIDTACQPKHYHEPGVGEGVARALKTGLRRDELYLQTKFTPLSGQDPERVPYDPAAPLAEQVAQSFRVSLKNLRTDYLDGLVLHSPLPGTQLDAVWRALEAIVDAGGARRIGISNCYDPEVLEALHRRARIKPAILQNRFYVETGYDREVRAFCRAQSIVYQSFWTLTANPRVLGDARMRALASKLDRTPAQLLFRYLTQRGIVPLTGTTTIAHMREDLAIFDFELGAEDCAALDSLFV